MRSLLLVCKTNIHKLVIIRHGESTSNKKNGQDGKMYLYPTKESIKLSNVLNY